LFGLVLFHYVRYDDPGADTMPALILLGAIVWAKAVSAGLWREGSDSGSVLEWMAGALAFLLAGLAVWRPKMAEFEYRNITRWSGVWGNPNLFGLMMGAGLLLSLGMMMDRSLKRPIQPGSASGLETPRRLIFIGLFVIASLICGYALVRSYSRGAWIGTVFGLIYLAGSVVTRTAAPGYTSLEAGHPAFAQCLGSWTRRNGLVVALIIVSIGVLGYWQFQHSRRERVVNRIVSVTNANDFSWRNRIAAWEGALQILDENAWMGTGLARPEPLFQQYYLPAKLTDGAAIQMNDYLMLGAALGMPVLACLAACVGLALFGDSPPGFQTPGFAPATCRAGALVLAIGFWFDGGLLELGTTSAFWVLLELGRLNLSALPETGAPSATAWGVRAGRRIGIV